MCRDSITFFSDKSAEEYLFRKRRFFFVKEIREFGIKGLLRKLRNQRIIGKFYDKTGRPHNHKTGKSYNACGYAILVVPDANLRLTMDTITHEYLHYAMRSMHDTGDEELAIQKCLEWR